MTEFFSKARKYLENAEIGDTLDEIKKFLDNHSIKLFSNEIISIKARYSLNRKNERLGLSSSDEISREWSKLIYVLAELLSEIEREVKIEIKRDALQKSYQDLESNSNPDLISPKTSEDWNSIRNSVYSESKGICLVHTLWPSKKDNQEYDIYIYLIKHKSDAIEEIEYAEFFLGEFWDNKVFKIENKSNKIGIYTSAYGPFLCLCKVKFKSGDETFIHRYIDFEQGELAKNP